MTHAQTQIQSDFAFFALNLKSANHFSLPDLERLFIHAQNRVTVRNKRERKIMEVGGHLPFKVEYSKSARASCKSCKNKIEKDVVRMARMMKSRHHDGVDPNWFHFECFWPKASSWGLGKGELDKVDGYHGLRPNDQEMVEEKVNNVTALAVKTARGKKGAKKGAAVVQEVVRLEGFEIGYAPSSRAKCRKTDCKIEKIAKNELRIAHMQTDEDKPHLGLIPRWHHIGCFKKARKEYGWRDDEYSIEMVAGWPSVDPGDKEQLLKIFKMKKPKAEPKAEVKEEPEKGDSKDDALKAMLKGQNTKLWKVQDALTKDFQASAIKELLDANDIEHPVGAQAQLTAAADCILFGQLPPCPGECSSGKLRIASSAKFYTCTGNISSFTKCDFKTQDAKRSKPVIPKWIKDESPFLFKYKYDPKLLRAFPEQTKGSIPPLTEMKVLTLGKLKGKEKIEAQVKELGGINAAALDETVHLIITTKDIFDEQAAREKPSARFTKSKTLDTMILSIELLDQLKTAKVTLGEQRVNLVPFLDNYKLSVWGSFKKPGRRKRFFDGEEEAIENKRVKLDVSNGVAIDPEAEVKPGSRIVEEGGKMHTSMMTAINIKQDKNSYYKLQAIQNPKGTKFTLFRSWGRIGSKSIGGTKTQEFHNKTCCLDEFYRLFEEKTQNSFFAKSKYFMTYSPCYVRFSLHKAAGLFLSNGCQLYARHRGQF